MAVNQAIQLPFEKYTDPGLYLFFDDGVCLTLTREFIDKTKQRYLQDPQLLPPEVREAQDYELCSICPAKETSEICHAIPTVFPFLEHVNRFLSYEPVTALYRPEPSDSPKGDSVLHVARTTVQRAVQYVSILSLMHYCEVGRAYYKYFAGVIPFMDPLMIAERVYLNMYWDLHGDVPAINSLIAQLRYELDVTVRCQMKRLRLFCKSDPFLNAFANMHIATMFLELSIETRMRERFNARNMSSVQPGTH